MSHEGVGVVELIGPMVRNFAAGERVIIPSTIGCGFCNSCREGYFAQCDNANPAGKRAVAGPSIRTPWRDGRVP